MLMYHLTSALAYCPIDVTHLLLSLGAIILDPTCQLDQILTAYFMTGLTFFTQKIMVLSDRVHFCDTTDYQTDPAYPYPAGST